jgi:hypothetical protein
MTHQVPAKVSRTTDNSVSQAKNRAWLIRYSPMQSRRHPQLFHSVPISSGTFPSNNTCRLHLMLSYLNEVANCKAVAVLYLKLRSSNPGAKHKPGSLQLDSASAHQEQRSSCCGGQPPSQNWRPQVRQLGTTLYRVDQAKRQRKQRQSSSLMGRTQAHRDVRQEGGHSQGHLHHHKSLSRTTRFTRAAIHKSGHFRAITAYQT